MAPHRNKRDPKKPAGRKTSYAFFVQFFREQQKKQYPDSKVPFSELTKQCAATWHRLTADQKAYFENLAEKDKERYQEEMRNYQPPAPGAVPEGKEPKKQPKKQPRKKKDPNAPRRPLNAFSWFANDERPAVKKRFPNYRFLEVDKELRRMWAASDVVRRDQYKKMAQRDRERYDREHAVYVSGAGQGQQQSQGQSEAGQGQPSTSQQMSQ